MEEMLFQVNELYDKTVGERDTANATIASITDQLNAARAGHDSMAAQLAAAKTDRTAAEAARDNVLSQLASVQIANDGLKLRVKELEDAAGPVLSPDLIDVDTFRERLAPAFFAYASLADGDPKKSKWGILLGNYLPTNRQTPVNIASQATQGLVQQAVADGLLTPAQAAVVLAQN